LLLIRSVVGAAFIFHGASKIQHPFSWMTATAGAHAFVAPPFLQAVAAGTEYAGGILLILGLLTPLISTLLFVDMAVALFAVELPRGVPFVGMGHTYETALVYLVIALALVLTGPGSLSLDRWLSAILGEPVRTRTPRRYSLMRSPRASR
jgi:putative oxidoreductase